MIIAGVQMDIALMEKTDNLHRIIAKMHETASEGAELTVFPECALTGYCFDSLQEAVPLAETIPGPTTKTLQQVCRELKQTVVIGMLEQAAHGVYNSAVVITNLIIQRLPHYLKTIAEFKKTLNLITTNEFKNNR